MHLEAVVATDSHRGELEILKNDVSGVRGLSHLQQMGSSEPVLTGHPAAAGCGVRGAQSGHPGLP